MHCRLGLLLDVNSCFDFGPAEPFNLRENETSYVSDEVEVKIGSD